MAKLTAFTLSARGAALAALALPLWLGLMAGAAIAADTVLLRYRGFGRAIPVAAFTTLAETGQPPDPLDGLLRTANQDPKALQDVLIRPLTVDPNQLDEVLNSWPGEWALDQLGEIIRPPAGQASRQALRSALVLSAANDGQITLLEVLQQYPTREVVLEGDRAEEAYSQLSRLLGVISIF